MIARQIRAYSQLLRPFYSSRLLPKRCFSVPPAADREEALFKFIQDKIKTNGPITVHEYMQLAASSGAGYYYNKNNGNDSKIFGPTGDFVTSPELTQVFGELLGVWVYNELANTGHRGPWNLVELGPGTGKLMSDILKVMQRFEEDKLAVHLIEISDSLIDTQEQMLCGSVTKNAENKSYLRKSRSLYGVTVYWYKDVADIPDDFTVFVANEFLDALPIHQFTKTPKGWHEVYVNLNDQQKLCFMLSKGENLHTKGLLPEGIRNEEHRRHFEVSPEAGTVVSQVADFMIKNGGFALFIDYGHAGERRDLSLRAYHKHEQVNPLEHPGKYDLTADVNFGYLKDLVDKESMVYGPVEQRMFLAQLGILVRMQYLMQNTENLEDRKSLFNAYKMLMTPTEEGGMGSAFKCFSMFPKSLEGIMQKRGGFPDGFRPFGPDKGAEATEARSDKG